MKFLIVKNFTEKLLGILFLILISTSAFSQVKEKEKIAIYPFSSYNSSYYGYATSIENSVEMGFVKSGRFTVVEREKFDQLSLEEQFKEANTSDVVAIASKLGAQKVVLGHVVGVSTSSKSGYAAIGGNYYIEHTGIITFSIKIVDVKTGEISISESLSLRGVSREGSRASLDAAYLKSDSKIQQFIGAYFPQRFALMDVTNFKQNAVDEFRIWAGSDSGIEENSVLEIFEISKLVNPDTGKVAESKELIGEAKIVAINGTDISTCKMLKRREGKIFQESLASNSENIVIEFSGAKKGFLSVDEFDK